MKFKSIYNMCFGLVLSLGLGACGGDDNPEPSDSRVVDVPTGGTGGGGGSGGSSDEDPDGPGPIDDRLDREDCPEEPDSTQRGVPCWDVSACNGTESIQFLEQCSDTCFAPFDNQARIEGFTGSLPPLS